MARKTIGAIYLLVYFALSYGCITTDAERRRDYDARMRSWLGVNINEMIDSWGYHQNSFKIPNGNTVYVWAYSKDLKRSYPVYEPGTTVKHDLHGSFRTGNNNSDSSRTVGSIYGTSTTDGKWVSKEYTERYWCNTFVEVDNNNTIVRIRAKGNNCY
jgi:hypothetical protein